MGRYYLIKNFFFIVSIILFLAVLNNSVYASPFYTPSFRFLSANQLHLGIKEVYTRENNFGLENVIWRSNIEMDLYYGINKELELDLSFPYTSGGTDNQSGLGDSLVYLKYRIFSNQDYILSDRELDIALQLGGKIKTGEVKKGLGGKDTEVLYSILGRYEIGILNGKEYFFYFHLGLWSPIEGYYTYKNIFQYDFALEYQANKKFSVFLEGNGNRTSDYDIVYIGPGVQFHPSKDWDINFAISGTISDKGGFFNTKSLFGLIYNF